MRKIIEQVYSNSDHLPLFINSLNELIKRGFKPVRSPLWTDVLGAIAWVIDLEKAPCIYFCKEHGITLLVPSELAQEAQNITGFKFASLFHFSDPLGWAESEKIENIETVIDAYLKIVKNL